MTVLEALKMLFGKVERLEQRVSTVPVGTIDMFSTLEIPDGWLLCDGRAVSRNEYGALFEVIQTRYGGGDGTTTFNLPNMVGRFSFGCSTNCGATGGTTKHTNQLNASGMAHVTAANNGGDNMIYMRIASSPQFTSNHNIGSGHVSTSWQTTRTNAATLMGVTGEGTHIPPYLQLPYIIKA